MLLSTAASAEQLKAIALITPEQPADFGWNQQGIEGAQAAAKAHGLEFLPAAGVGYGDVRPTLRELVDNGAGLVIIHGPYTENAIEVANETKTPMAVTSEDIIKPPYITGYTLGGQDGAYLAGQLAAKMTKTGKLGIVVSAESPTWNAQTAGFVLGARSVTPKVEIHYAVIGPQAYSDVAGARRVTETMLATGADIILGQGDGATFGMLQAIDTFKAPEGVKPWFIDVIGDKTSIDKGELLSSIVWNFEPVFSQIIDDVENGTFAKHGYQLRLEDNSIGLLHTKHIPDDVWTSIMKTRDDIIAGKISIPKVFDAAKVKAMLADAQ
jgi:simple sugar transport system substrate-binding protein